MVPRKLPIEAGKMTGIHQYRNKDAYKLHWDECHKSKLYKSYLEIKSFIGVQHSQRDQGRFS